MSLEELMGINEDDLVDSPDDISILKKDFFKYGTLKTNPKNFDGDDVERVIILKPAKLNALQPFKGILHMGEKRMN